MKVYFWDDLGDVRGGVDKLLDIIASELDPSGVAFKIHFGEEGNDTYVKPEWLKGIPERFPGAIFVDCNVLYRGSRTRRADHLAVAEEHGFGFLPIDILDGEWGEEECGLCIRYCPSGAVGNSAPGTDGQYAAAIKQQVSRFSDGCLQFDFARCLEDRTQKAALYPDYVCARCVAICAARGKRRISTRRTLA